MDKTYPVSTPMVVRLLEKNKDLFRPRDKGEELLVPEVSYLSAIGALMYLANCTRLDIVFFVNLLAKHSSAPTRRHWIGVKQIFRYFRGTMDMGLFYAKDSQVELVGYADAGYQPDPHKGRSQTCYIFTYCDTAISWRSTKQTLAATSSNHAELLSLYEASRECLWLRTLVHHIRDSCGLSVNKRIPTTLYEDNEVSSCGLTGDFASTEKDRPLKFGLRKRGPARLKWEYE
ncbi:secreted RxLR effector protein 161-like [Apium graveolens]|uniref:secreted RxLR effector protein 161-like n=1 Tax=Apium graveolens TaxID=4045 RepID=UPI003D79F38F